MGLSGAEGRFRQLYVEHYPALLAYALRRSTDRGEAEDAVADAFVVLWRRIDQAPTDGHEALLWLYGVIRRVIANRSRGRRRQRRVAQRFAEIAQLQPGADDTAEARLNASRLVRALQNLKEPEREVLLLAAWEGLTASQIAIVLGCSENAAAIRLHRARRRLTAIYEKENASDGHMRKQEAAPAALGKRSIR
ncbi:MAG TPA: sigma-70 family RNA polymerase sigma factor [Gaiellaceae bacterium]|nr:sigma-70 family RNA polymerase sigma factor [Gaiellaceae bacterium]